jgi:HEAT repeat protein
VIGRKRRQLVRALLDGDEPTRWAAAQALSGHGDRQTVLALERILEGEHEEAPRAAAAYVLGFSEQVDAAPLLARILADPRESAAVRAYAAEALGHLLQFQPVLAQVRTAVRRGLGDSVIEIRFWCAFAAGVLGLQETRPHLERLAATDDEEVEGWWSVAEEADWALQVLDGEEDPPLPQRTQPES